jgi:hypothetical protein
VEQDRIPPPKFSKQGNLVFACGCENDHFDFEPKGWQDLRVLSNQWMSDGSAANRRVRSTGCAARSACASFTCIVTACY